MEAKGGPGLAVFWDGPSGRSLVFGQACWVVLGQLFPLDTTSLSILHPHHLVLHPALPPSNRVTIG